VHMSVITLDEGRGTHVAVKVGAYVSKYVRRGTHVTVKVTVAHMSVSMLDEGHM
jgi:hypothetical protein